MAVVIRPEEANDREDIYRVTADAFRGRPYAGGNEQDLVNRLRELGQLSVSLVAMDEDQLIGHVAFSPVVLSDDSGPWFGLGPVSVSPACQGQGVGGKLIRSGLVAIAARGALGCVLTGDPAYYQRFGFDLAPKNVPEAEPAEFFQLKLLRAIEARGTFAFHPAFYETPAPSPLGPT